MRIVVHPDPGAAPGVLKAALDAFPLPAHQQVVVPDAGLPERLARAKVRDPARRVSAAWDPLPLEVQAETRALEGRGRAPGPLYDGTALLQAFQPAFEPRSPGVHVLVTDRLVATFEDRYHIRYAVLAGDAVVSPPGFVDGPARDRSYYFAKHILGTPRAVDDDHVTPGDPRLPTLVASALLQAVAYAATGEAFCPDVECRLFNPHWQREALRGTARDTLCPRHAAWVASRTA